ncbi:MAG: hypothetical protein AAF499_00455 [Pseudomonadota bacterium]
MTEVLRRYIDIALLRGTPANLPAGTNALGFAVLFALASYVFVGSLDASFGSALNRGLVDLGLSAALLFFTLAAFARVPRFQQSFSALCGASGMVNLAAFPLMWRLSELPDGVEPGAGFLLPWTLLMVWLVAIQAHVLRSTLECRPALALALAVGYLVVAFAVFDILF